MMGTNGSLVTTRRGMLSLEEAALGLSRLPRFAGQTVVPWTVAHHLLVCREMAKFDRELPVHALLHDFHEALTGDIPTTFKTRDIRRTQRRLDARVYAAFNVPLPTTTQASIIKKIDGRALLAEAAVVTPTCTYERICYERDTVAIPQDVLTVESLLISPQEAHEDLLTMLEWDVLQAQR